MSAERAPFEGDQRNAATGAFTVIGPEPVTVGWKIPGRWVSVGSLHAVTECDVACEFLVMCEPDTVHAAGSEAAQ
ncbi:hypothetical protein [Streptomyces mirabilis]|uniref:hypothetical protein n=1 Tax=Streptomyces mirabilis TaxID=68239 RepID=UPI00369053BB